MATKNWTKPILYASLLNAVLIAGEVKWFLYNKFQEQNQGIVQTQTANPKVDMLVEKSYPKQRTITTTFVPTTSEGKRTYIEANTTTNYARASPTIRTNSPKESLEKKILEQAIKSSLEKKVQSIKPLSNKNDLYDCTAKAETPHVKPAQEITLIETNNKEPEENISNILNKYIGKPYGPKYPSKKNRGYEMYDCVSLVQAVAKDLGKKINEGEGDKIYARHTKPVTILSPEKFNLNGVKPGDIVFIGHKYARGEGGISAYHLGIIEGIKYNSLGKPIDATMVHASGSYSKNRKSYHGRGVVREPLTNYLNKFKNDERKNHMFIGRLSA